MVCREKYVGYSIEFALLRDGLSGEMCTVLSFAKCGVRLYTSKNIIMIICGLQLSIEITEELIKRRHPTHKKTEHSRPGSLELARHLPVTAYLC